MSRFPAIPEPGVTPEGMRETVAALKNAVETLANQRGVGRTPRVFVQIDAPKNTESELGDFWVKKDSRELFYFDTTWEAFV